VYDPGGGAASTWYVQWNPVAGSPVYHCEYGKGTWDQPIAGLDRNLDRRTDLAFFRGREFGGAGYLYTRLSVDGDACNGADHDVSYTMFTRPRLRVWAVADMTGDGKAEILVLEPDTMRLDWLRSDDDYLVSNNRTLGSAWAVVL
jgi:hypothetical protein